MMKSYKRLKGGLALACGELGNGERTWWMIRWGLKDILNANDRCGLVNRRNMRRRQEIVHFKEAWGAWKEVRKKAVSREAF